MKKIILLALAGATIIGSLTMCTQKYQTVDGDPLGTKIYTLENGLKVFMSVNKETPRIQTYIAVRSGGKNDPSDNTGLAHYLEHIMFKGSESFGTTDYAAEKPMLDEIQRLFDVYGQTTDPAQRDSIYHLIDSVSYEASKLAIPNEYDKMMAIIGSKGSNAFTSTDVTCYIEDIPSNQIENWANVQADRFKNLVIRGFHTELEAVYEEKNTSLVSDFEKAMEKVDSMLYKNHPYGKQTVIGTQDHLKNPSITAILKQRETYYVPNNVAICLSGDFDPDQMVEIIKKYFGDWKANPNLPEFKFEPEQPATAMQSKDVYGNDEEFALLAWRVPGTSSKESNLLTVANMLLNNGMAGILDLDITQQQKLNFVQSYPNTMNDYSELMLIGSPKEGQSLEEVKDILVAEIAKLRNGEFDDELVKATINNIKLQDMKSLEKNSSRAMKYVDAFVDGISWEEAVRRQKDLEKISKEDIVAWAGKYLKDTDLVVVYKHLGTDNSIKKIDAPKITPIVTNRDKASDFLVQVQENEPQPIEPVFTNYTKDMAVSSACGMKLLYKQNTLNDIATVSFRYDAGTVTNPALGVAADYLSYLGTETRSAEEIAKEMYSLACSFNLSAGETTTTVSITGLSENIAKAVEIVEDLIYNAKIDEAVLDNLKADIIKSRENSKLNQNACFRAMQKYITYGPEFIKQTTLDNKALVALDADKLLQDIRDLALCKHTILYYGPESQNKIIDVLGTCHKVAEDAKPLEKVHIAKLLTPQTKVYVANYKARQFRYTQYSDKGEGFDPGRMASITLFNEYFGGGMNSIVFQEMREARALAYSAGAYYASPSYLEGTSSFIANINSQNDKLAKAVAGFKEIIEEMPKSDKALEIAKTSLLTKYRTERKTGMNVLYSYLADKELGLDGPLDGLIFRQIGNMSLDDLETFTNNYIIGRNYVYGIVGDTSDLDMAFLAKLGPVKVVSLEEIFGY